MGIEYQDVLFLKLWTQSRVSFSGQPDFNDPFTIPDIVRAINTEMMETSLSDSDISDPIICSARYKRIFSLSVECRHLDVIGISNQYQQHLSGPDLA